MTGRVPPAMWVAIDHKQPWTWLAFVIVVILIVTSVSNGANLTDGLDGLATGTSAIIGTALGILAYLSSNVIYSNYLNIMYIPNSQELVIFASSFIGATIGFLWYNSYPAQVFMGDTGSLALGGIIAVFAIVIRKELLIPILCGIFLVENLSVVIQVGWFNPAAWRGRLHLGIRPPTSFQACPVGAPVVRHPRCLARRGGRQSARPEGMRMMTTEEKTFRAEVADWMAHHLTGRFEVLRHRGGPGDETAHSELRREWEQVMASGGWIDLAEAGEQARAVDADFIHLPHQAEFNGEPEEAGQGADDALEAQEALVLIGDGLDVLGGLAGELAEAYEHIGEGFVRVHRHVAGDVMEDIGLGEVVQRGAVADGDRS